MLSSYSVYLFYFTIQSSGDPCDDGRSMLSNYDQPKNIAIKSISQQVRIFVSNQFL